jgi:hypothetical protein
MRKIITRKNQIEIYGGVSLGDDGRFTFNWKTDNPETDILLLSTSTSGRYTKEGVSHIYGYMFNPNLDSPTAKKKFRDALKSQLTNTHLFYSEEVELFVEDGIFNIAKFKSINDFKVIVRTESSIETSLLNVMHGYFMEYFEEGLLSDIVLMKQMYKDVKFNVEAAKQALRDIGKDEDYIEKEINYTLTKFEGFKATDQLFQMKRFIPKQIREGFYDFLTFRNERERRLYESLQGVDVLIYDDFLTSGTTIKEIIRILKSVNPKNTLTAFALIKQ